MHPAPAHRCNRFHPSETVTNSETTERGWASYIIFSLKEQSNTQISSHSEYTQINHSQTNCQFSHYKDISMRLLYCTHLPYCTVFFVEGSVACIHGCQGKPGFPKKLTKKKYIFRRSVFHTFPSIHKRLK